MPSFNICKVQPYYLFSLLYSVFSYFEDDEDEEEEEEEEDPEDPADALKDSCTKSASCKPLLKSFEICEERVNGRSHTEETCLEEYLGFIKCRDKCVSSHGTPISPSCVVT